jgi:hypothetical protein
VPAIRVRACGVCMPRRREVFGHDHRVPVLPDASWLALDLDELGIVVPASCHVGCEFLRLPHRVRLRRNYVLSAGVPMAAVDEHRHPQPRQLEIGLTLKLAGVKTEPATAATAHSAQPSLGPPLFRPLTGHQNLFRGHRRTPIRPTDHGIIDDTPPSNSRGTAVSSTAR